MNDQTTQQHLTDFISSGSYVAAFKLLAAHHHPIIQELFPKWEYRTTRPDDTVDFELTKYQVEDLRRFVAHDRFKGIVSTITLILFGGFGVALGIAALLQITGFIASDGLTVIYYCGGVTGAPLLIPAFFSLRAIFSRNYGIWTDN